MDEQVVYCSICGAYGEVEEGSIFPEGWNGAYSESTEKVIYCCSEHLIRTLIRK
jgi:hypothetical protein